MLTTFGFYFHLQTCWDTQGKRFLWGKFMITKAWKQHTEGNYYISQPQRRVFPGKEGSPLKAELHQNLGVPQHTNLA